MSVRLKSISVFGLALCLVAARADAGSNSDSSEPPWIRPPRLRGTFGVSGFGVIVAKQGGQNYQVDETLKHSGGVAIWAGLELGRMLGFEAKYEASVHDPVDYCDPEESCASTVLLLQTVSFDLKLHFPTRSRAVPYVVVGPTVGWLGFTNYSLSYAVGGGGEAGGGVDFWISRHGTVGIEALYRGLVMWDHEQVTSGYTYVNLIQIGATIAAHF